MYSANFGITTIASCIVWYTDLQLIESKVVIFCAYESSVYQTGLCSCILHAALFALSMFYFGSNLHHYNHAGLALSILRLFHIGKFHRSFAMSETSFTNVPHVGLIACISEYTFEPELLCADHNASICWKLHYIIMLSWSIVISEFTTWAGKFIYKSRDSLSVHV